MSLIGGEEQPSQTTMRDVVCQLAPLERRAGSPAEKQAAQWIARRLQEAGADANIEEETFLDGYAQLLLPLGLLGALVGTVAASGRGRRVAAALGTFSALTIADDASNGLRYWRRATAPRRTTWNVVAETGDLQAQRTLVVLAHHDAAPTGRIFDQALQTFVGETFPGLVERKDTSVPLWWLTVAGPLLAALGGVTGRRGLALAGAFGSAASAAIAADIANSPVVPGANDNLSAVAVLVALAERLREEPIEGLRVMLVSCGAEEVLQGGIYGFAVRHFPQLDREHTWFLNLDTIGSPRLILVEGEGTFLMEDYCDVRFRDLIANCAERACIPLRRGMRSRASSDAVIPNRAGYPTAMLASIDRNKSLSNYHLMSDTPENLDFRTLGHALKLTERLARALVTSEL